MDLLDELLTWIEDRSFGEWVGVFSLIVAILAPKVEVLPSEIRPKITL